MTENNKSNTSSWSVSGNFKVKGAYTDVMGTNFISFVENLFGVNRRNAEIQQQEKFLFSNDGEPEIIRCSETKAEVKRRTGVKGRGRRGHRKNRAESDNNMFKVRDLQDYYVDTPCEFHKMKYVVSCPRCNRFHGVPHMVIDESEEFDNSENSRNSDNPGDSDNSYDCDSECFDKQEESEECKLS
jgi:hypothetical protein